MGKHSRRDDTAFFGLVHKEPNQSIKDTPVDGIAIPAPEREPATEADVWAMIREYDPDTQPIPEIPDPDPPEYPDGNKPVGRWILLTAILAAVVLLAVSCAMMSAGSGRPAGQRTITVSPLPKDPPESALAAPERVHAAVRTVAGPTVTVRQTSPERAAESRPAAPAPTVTVTVMRSPALIRPEPRPTVTVTVTHMVPAILPSVLP